MFSSMAATSDGLTQMDGASTDNTAGSLDGKISARGEKKGFIYHSKGSVF